jgi:hypothetical protein
MVWLNEETVQIAHGISVRNLEAMQADELTPKDKCAACAVGATESSPGNVRGLAGHFPLAVRQQHYFT